MTLHAPEEPSGVPQTDSSVCGLRTRRALPMWAETLVAQAISLVLAAEGGSSSSPDYC